MGAVILLLLLLPALGALAVALGRPRHLRALALGAALAALAAAMGLGLAFHPGGGVPFPLLQGPWAWAPGLGLSWVVGLDGLSLSMVLLTTLVTPVVIALRSHEAGPRLRPWLVLVLLAESAVLGAFCALDLFLFYVFFELMLLPVVLLLGVFGGAQRVQAVTRLLVATLLGSFLLLVAIAVLLVLHQQQQHFASAFLPDLLQVRVPAGWGVWLAGAFLLAFGIKAAVVPLHGWMPAAYSQAPTGATILLSALLAKVGLYGMLRFALPLFPHATDTLAPLMLGLGAVGVIYGALLAWAQDDLKLLVAYASLSHLSLAMMGVFSGTLPGQAGGAWHLVNHGIYTTLLFLLVGWLADRGWTRLSQLGGLGQRCPRFALALGLTAFAAAGLPGLNGFVGEMLVLVGTWPRSPPAVGVAALGGILGALYLLNLLHHVLMGPLAAGAERLHDLERRESWILLPLLALLVGLGVAPQPLLGLQQPGLPAAQPAAQRAVIPPDAASHRAEGR